MKNISHVVLLSFLAILLALPAHAVSIRSLLGLDEEEEAAEETQQQPAKKEAAAAAPKASNNWAQSKQSSVDLELVKRLLLNLEPGKGREIIANEETFAQFVKQEINNYSVLSAARANKLDEDQNTSFLMQRGAENILREIYLNRLMREKLPKDFPSQEQVKEYYDKNKDKLVTPERVHVWQVFWPVSEDMDEKAVAALKKKANGIADQIRNNKLSFSDAAAKHSKHRQSNSNGGYMGLINSADLKPEIKKSILELDEGKISSALTTDTGIHVVKRGAIVAPRQITYEEGEAQVRTLLANQVRAQLRKAIYEQAAKTYPLEISDNKIEEWRLRLKTNVDAPKQ